MAEEAQVALELALAGVGALVAGVVDDDVGPADAAADAVDGWQDLFVNAVLPADLRVVGEQADLVDRTTVGPRGGRSGGHGWLPS